MDSIFGIWILCALVVAYFLPAIIAYRRDVPNMWSVAVINIFLGWTLIGWAVALALAVRDVKQKHTVWGGPDAPTHPNGSNT